MNVSNRCLLLEKNHEICFFPAGQPAWPGMVALTGPLQTRGWRFLQTRRHGAAALAQTATPGLLADAKLGKYLAQQIVRAERAGDLAQMQLRLTQVFGQQIQRRPGRLQLPMGDA